MPDIRNPFKIRAAEHIRNPDTFLRLFSAEILDIIDKDMFLNGIQIFRSSPGAGKTTLLRVFTPSILLTLYEMRAQEDYKDVFNKLNNLGVISNDGPELLGVSLSCSRNYATLEDLKFERVQKERILYSLLNARILLSLLKGLTEIKSLEYPDDLDKIRINFPNETEIPNGVPVSGTGDDLFNWGNEIEKQVCDVIDSYGPVDRNRMGGHDSLFSLYLLRPEYFTYQGGSLAKQISVMFDDVHKLTPIQRQNFLKTIINLRPSVSVWVFERLEALSPVETFESAAKGRDYHETDFETFWRPTSSSKTFERAIKNVADKRAALSFEFHERSFSDCLKETLDEKWESKLRKVNLVLSERVRNEIKLSKIFQSWVSEVERRDQLISSPLEKSIAWRTLEIMIARAKRKAQLTLDLNIPVLSLKEKEESRIRESAELFLAKEFKVPYYYGFTKISDCSSLNFDQFLSFAGELFEEIISTSLTKKRQRPLLFPDRQHHILKRVAEQKWEDVPRKVPHGRDVQEFLEKLCLFAQKETFVPGASYPPGVTGIAITMVEHNFLLNRLKAGKKDEYTHLANIIALCISNNLLDAIPNHNQGGKKWWLLYLNRWLCIKFDLPFGYGGWRRKKVKELVTWIPYAHELKKGELL